MENANRMAEVAKMFGKKLGDEFLIEWKTEDGCTHHIGRFTGNGLETKYPKDEIPQDVMQLWIDNKIDVEERNEFDEYGDEILLALLLIGKAVIIDEA